MKLSKVKDPQVLRILQHVSEDATRFHLCAVYHDDALPYAVATDGHRLYATRDVHRESMAGRSADAEVLAVTGQSLPADRGVFPDWKTIVPRGRPARAVTLTVPAWFAKLKRSDRGLAVSIRFRTDSDQVALCFGNAPAGDGEESAGVNPFYLAPYAGQTVRVYLPEGRCVPFVITPADAALAKLDQVFSLPWFGLIMPIRPEPGAARIIERAPIGSSETAPAVAGQDSEAAPKPEASGPEDQAPDLPVAPAREALGPNMVRSASVNWFQDAKGYGFLTVEGYTDPVFVHYTALVGNGFKTLREGQLVHCEVIDGPKGPQASRVLNWQGAAGGAA